MQDSSQINPVRLRTIFNKLFQTDYVKDARAGRPVQLSDQILEDLQNALRLAQPSNKYEACYRKTVYFMYKMDKRGFMDFLRNNNALHFVLWTDAMNIVHHLGLRDKVYLRWQGRQYMVHFHKKYKFPGKRMHPLARKKVEQKTILAREPQSDSGTSFTGSEDMPGLVDVGSTPPLQGKWSDMVDPEE